MGEKPRLSCGLDVVIAADLNVTLQENLTSFDFVCLPLVHPRFKRDFSNPLLDRQSPLTRSDFLLPSTEWTSVIVAKLPRTLTMALDSKDEMVRYNAEMSFHQELSLAVHLSVPAVMVELRSGDCLNLARCLSSFLNKHQAGVVWVRVPMVSQKKLLDNLRSSERDKDKLSLDHFPPLSSSPSRKASKAAETHNDNSKNHEKEEEKEEKEEEEEEEEEEESTWHWWNRLHTLLQLHPRLRIALQLTSDLPPEQELARWSGEPVKALIVPTRIFVTNKKGFPVLSPRHQAVVKGVKSDVQMVVSGRLCHVDKVLLHYKAYLNHLHHQRASPDIISTFSRGYEDYLQCPLQPLMDDLESQTYEVFEKDPVKYNNYQKAIHLALLNRTTSHPATEETTPPIVVMVLGAGRGPLVQATLKAADSSKRNVKVFAIEKNPHAVVTLRNLREDEWGERVTVVEEDMRSWQTTYRADIVVSELLGSFGDNELSPECLDGAERFLKDDAVSIPCRYSSYLAPVHSSKLWNESKGCFDASKPTGSHFETPYVVHLHNSRLVDQPKTLFTFHHPQRLNPPSKLPHSNSRHEQLTFHTDVDTPVHGFAGYFHCTLYKHITISIEPSTHTPSMFSWFPIYFPIHQPFLLRKGHHLVVDFWRVVSGKGVWYEWAVSSPTLSKVHNLDGRCYSIGL